MQPAWNALPSLYATASEEKESTRVGGKQSYLVIIGAQGSIPAMAFEWVKSQPGKWLEEMEIF